MNPFLALKRRLAKRFAKSTLVQNAVLAQLEDDPKALASLGKNPAVFEQVLAGAALSESAVTRIIDSPAVLNRIMRSPKVFERLLEAVAGNPEILYRMLGQRNMRRVLSAQNGFLKRIGMERNALAQVLAGVPSNARADAIRVLTGPNPEFLRGLGDTPDQMAAALLYRNSGKVTDIEQIEAADRIILDGVIDALEAAAPAVVLEMVKSNPALFDEGSLRDQALRSIVSNADNMRKLCALYVVNPKNGVTLGERAHKLLVPMLGDLVFVQALMQSEDLRMSMLHIVEDSAASAGEAIPDMLARPRSPKPGEA
jgi:hypothetical protein